MNTYDKILSQFRKLNYQDTSYFQQNQINKALDTISFRNAGFPQFDRSIAEQLWTHCPVDPTRGVKLQDYINTIIEAENILREQVAITEKALHMENRPSQRSELQSQYNQILSDHRIITSPFNLPPLRQPPQTLQSSHFNHNQQQSLHREGQTVIFASEPNLRQQSSTDLKICLFLAVAAFLWELILMFTKHHFLNLLCIFAILSIFFLNYFDKNYMKLLLLLIAISVVFDIAWLVVNAKEYWNPAVQTQHSTLHTGFLIFVFIMVIVLMVLRIIMFGILFKYKQNGESFRKSVSIFGYRIKLDGRPSYNLFSPLLRSAPIIGIH